LEEIQENPNRAEVFEEKGLENHWKNMEDSSLYEIPNDSQAQVNFNQEKNPLYSFLKRFNEDYLPFSEGSDEEESSNNIIRDDYDPYDGMEEEKEFIPDSCVLFEKENHITEEKILANSFVKEVNLGFFLSINKIDIYRSHEVRN